MYKLKPIELSLMLGVLIALIWGAGTAQAQEELSDRLIRLHVIAHSDSPEDQERKLAVRDAVLAQVRVIGEDAESAAQMAEILNSALPELEQTAREVLLAQDCGQSVAVTLTDTHFPTKAYDGFALPAGEYTALRVVIGSGEGENWWCVAFPPLCVGASSQSIEQAAQAGHFTPEQKALVTGQSGEYVIRFKSMELLGRMKQALDLFFS